MENNWAARHMFAAAASCSSYPSSTQQLVDPSLGGAHGHHITCLKLGKRQYYAGDHAAAAAAAAGAIKRDRQSSSSAAATHVIPTCQVEGCTKSLMDAKDYHRRHKVCEMHSKAPKVVVLGSEQRFCQQCSRFHAISEFDDSKRSCRRRLAGHNERRRKSNSSDSTPSRNPIPTPGLV